jgi:tetratricopeptide (TPR) repeat protein
MQFHVFHEEDKTGTVNRCFLDAKNGRGWLALQRLAELREIFPDDPEIDMAEAILRIEFLGQGFRGQELYWKAFHREPKLEDALRNAIKYSPDADSFHERASFGLRSFPDDPVLKMLLESEKTAREEGEPYWIFQRQMLDHVPHEQDPGTFAALIELILHDGSDDIPPDQQAYLLRLRGESLRRIDQAAQDKLKFHGEAHMPKERIALQQALSEFDNKIDDPYFRNAETLDLCASWAYLLHQFQASIAYADAAIAMGGQEYINPIRNKALALSAQGKKEEAVVVFQEALEKAKRLFDKTQFQIISEAIKAQQKTPPPNLTELLPLLETVLGSAGDSAYHEITSGKGTLESVGGHFLTRLNIIGFEWSPKYILALAELLTFYSPDAAYFIIQKALSDVPEQFWNLVDGHLRIAAQYLSAYATGSLQYDAVRLRVLQLISSLDADLILDAYRRQVRDISIEADPPLSDVAGLIKSEMTRIHPLLPNFLDNQAPISTEDRQRARAVINEVFSFRFKPTHDMGFKIKAADQKSMPDIQKQQPATQKSWFRKSFGR